MSYVEYISVGSSHTIISADNKPYVCGKNTYLGFPSTYLTEYKQKYLYQPTLLLFNFSYASRIKDVAID